MRARVGETFEVVLESNATAGYRWELAAAEREGGRVVLLDEVWDGDTSRAGGPTKQRFRFRALAEGSATLDFQYRRPWEHVPPSEVKSVPVDVSPAPRKRDSPKGPAR